MRGVTPSTVTGAGEGSKVGPIDGSVEVSNGAMLGSPVMGTLGLILGFSLGTSLSKTVGIWFALGVGGNEAHSAHFSYA